MGRKDEEDKRVKDDKIERTERVECVRMGGSARGKGGRGYKWRGHSKRWEEKRGRNGSERDTRGL